MVQDANVDNIVKADAESVTENQAVQGDVERTGIWQVSIWSVVKELRKQQIPEPEIRRRLECLLKEADMSIDIDLFLEKHED